MDDKKNVYITLHKNFVHEGIEYEDRKTGETKTFNSVTLPKGTVVNGQDVSYSQFSPLFVNPSRFKGENYRDIPLLAEKEVWLKKSVLEPDGSPTLDEDGKQVREVIKVMPAALKEGIDKGRAAYLASLDDKAKEAREASANQTRLLEHRGQDSLCGIHDHMDVCRRRDRLLRKPVRDNATGRKLCQERHQCAFGARCGNHSGSLVQLREPRL